MSMQCLLVNLSPFFKKNFKISILQKILVEVVIHMHLGFRV